MRFAAPAIAVALLAALGVRDIVHSSQMSELQSSGVVQARLDSIPLKFGEWTGEVKQLDPKLLKASNAIAHSNRRYTRRGAKPAIVDVLILAGEPGEIGAHDPERCYDATGYRIQTKRDRKTAVDVGVTHSLWSQKFVKDEFPVGRIEVAWGWTPDGHWQAADDARLDYAGQTILYKVYLSRTLGPTEADAVDPTGELFAELAPLARTVLAAP